MKKSIRISENTILWRNPKQIFSVIDEEVVLLNIELEEYVNMNMQGSFIWQKLEISHSFDELINLLCNEYNVERQICILETIEFLEGLIQKNMILYSNDES